LSHIPSAQLARVFARVSRPFNESGRLSDVFAHNYKAIAALAVLPVALIAPPAAAADAIPAAVRAAVADAGRPPQDLARDAKRKPDQVIAFTGAKPGDKIAELLPGDGYYTRILSKLAGPKGKVYPFVPIIGTQEQQKAREEADAKAGKPPGMHSSAAPMLAIQNIAEYNNVVTIWEMPWQLDTKEQFGVPEQVDVVFTAGEYHDLHNMPRSPDGKTPLDVAAFDKAIFRAVKPGGTFTVIDHAANKGAGFGATETLHRTDPDAVKAEILSAGFTFDGDSQALANASDNHAKPANEGAMYDDSDKYMMRFKKPANAAGDNRPKVDPLAGLYGNTYVGAVGLPTERRVFYHENGTYQEFGHHDMQSGTLFWNADGNSCMLHQFPADQRNFVVCHPRPPRKLGDSWSSTNAVGETSNYTVVKGNILW
jgi:predicted methyltransferase